ncbi:MAG: putative immunity protein [Carnobacterium sp.]|uniref:putative immunity protein n=1 Tax=Carnobacterium sp. TaxID=48221 RepID=UPI003C78605D
MTTIKLNIMDNSKLRKEINHLYEQTDQVTVAKWGLALAKHVLIHAKIDYNSIDELIDGFKENENWQVNNASLSDLRQASFNIHKLAQKCDSEITKTALRAAGQAVSSGHVKEHAIIASDYAIKTIGLLYSNDINSITLEREWQVNDLKRIRK